MAAQLHFKEYPYHRNLFYLDVREIEGEKFKDWQGKANYRARVTAILQVNSTQVSEKEYSVAPNITFLSVNQAIINIYQTWHVEGVSFADYQRLWAEFETGLEKYIYELMYKLNSARHSAALPGEWFINYALNEKHIEVVRP